MRLLLVEDENKIALALKKGLEQESFVIDIAETGIKGFDLASTEDYDLIVLDIMLPGMDGISVCKILRAENKTTPIIMLTAKGELDDKVTGLNIGADDYLTKPFAFDELLARIRALLRRPHNLSSEVLTCDDLSLDVTSLSVKRASKDISLSKKEFSLLEFMLSNKNKVLTKDQIISHVWGFDDDVLPNTVEQYVGYLRNKIDKDFPGSIQLIKTVRGFGYKITEENV